MFELNEKVKVKENIQAGVKYNDIYCHNGMLKFKGKTVTVGNFPYKNHKDVFNIQEDLEGYLWSSGMLENKE